MKYNDSIKNERLFTKRIEQNINSGKIMKFVPVCNNIIFNYFLKTHKRIILYKDVKI